MITKNKKNFLNSIESGAERDQQIRDSILNRFDRVDTTLYGRASLLHQQENKTTLAAKSESFHVETLIQRGKATRRYTQLPLSLIDDNPLNSRTFYSEEKIRERAASIAAHTQIVPALVSPSAMKEGRFTLVDGHYRKRANLHLGNTEMNVCVLDGLTPIDFYKLARALNSEREQESILDVAFGYRKLLDEGYVQTEEELSQIVGESKAKINKCLALTTLPQRVLDIITKYPTSFGVSIGYELTLYRKVTDDNKTTQLAERIAREALPVLKVESIRKKAEEGTKIRRNTSRQYKIIRGGLLVGTLKEWDKGRVTVDITFEDATKREAYIASIKHQLELDEPNF